MPRLLRSITKALRKAYHHCIVLSSPSNPFDKLPIELLLEIGNELDIISRVCLALTSRSLLNILGPSAFKHPCLRIPSSLVALRNKDGVFIKGFSLAMIPRYDLLWVLENKRWLYCCGCRVLHPTREFSRPDRCEPSRSCELYSHGTVHVCPGFTLSFRRAQSLTRYLKNPTVPNKYRFPGREWKINYTLQSPKSDFRIKIDIRVVPSLDPDCALVITMDYFITFEHPCDASANAEISFCPHHCFRFGMRKYAPHSRFNCSSCSTSITMRKQDKPNFEVEVCRNMGTATKHPDEVWKKHIMHCTVIRTTPSEVFISK